MITIEIQMIKPITLFIKTHILSDEKNTNSGVIIDPVSKVIRESYTLQYI